VIPGRAYKPEDVLRIAWTRKWIILIPFVIASIAAGAYAWHLPNRYVSETLILVVPQRVPESYVRSTVTTRIEDRLQSISQQILSRTRLERVINDFQLYQRERQNQVLEDIVERMRADIEVQIVKGDAFRVSYVSDNPRSAMRVTERLASLFIEENLRDREVLAEGTSEFLSSQLESARRRLVEHEQKLEAYRRRYSGELPSQVEANLQVIQNTQMQVQALVESINRDRDRRLLLERMLSDQTTPVSTPIAATTPEGQGRSQTEGDDGAGGISGGITGGSTHEKLAHARASLAALETRLKPEHPDVVRMKRVVADLEKQAEAEAIQVPLSPEAVRASADPVDPVRRRRVRELRAEIDALDTQLKQKEEEEKRLRSASSAYQGRVEASLTRESELAELMRDYETLQATYTSLLAKKEDSQMAANLERRQIGEQFKILDPARLPERPFSPNRPQIALIGALAGLALGLGLAGLMEYRDTTLKTDDDVISALALPVLAVVPVMTTARDRVKARRKRFLVSATTAATVVIGVAALLFWTFRS
jgi:polysaccharide chain length determinant protein (PEP-CTERM system associated)